MSIGRAAALVALMSLTLGVGCAAGPRADRPQPRSEDGAYRPVPTTSGAKLLAPREGQRRFQVETDGRRTTWTETWTRLPAQEGDDGERWAQVIEGVRRVEFLVGEDGSVKVTREVEVSEDSDVSYEPALLVLPAEVKQDTPAQGEARMTVKNLKGTNTKASGPVTVTVTPVGRTAVTTDDGATDAVAVRAQRKMDLDLAKVRVNIETVYVPGRGTWRETVERVTQALGVFEDRKRQTVQRIGE